MSSALSLLPLVLADVDRVYEHDTSRDHRAALAASIIRRGYVHATPDGLVYDSDVASIAPRLLRQEK